MSTLRETIELRLAAELTIPNCITLGPTSPGVVVEVWEKETWTFPWSQLVAARVTGGVADELLELMFGDFRVKARGKNLRGLIPEIANFRLHQLCNLPTAYEGNVPPAAPFVRDLDVSPAPSLPEKESKKSLELS